MNKEEYEKESKKLLNKWKQLDHHKNKGFVSDGIVDFDEWEKADQKILVVLKEAYGDKKQWKLTDLIGDDDREKIKNYPHYKMLSKWLYVLHNTTHDKLPESIEDIDPDLADSYLLSCAVINIKKSSGKSTSNNNEIYDYAVQDKDFLKKQIDLINPQIVLCGYTASSLLSGVYDLDDYNQYYFSDYCISFEGRTFIDFWHPSMKNGREEYYCNELSRDYQAYLKAKLTQR
jgi:hypothetical protein